MARYWITDKRTRAETNNEVAAKRWAENPNNIVIDTKTGKQILPKEITALELAAELLKEADDATGN